MLNLIGSIQVSCMRKKFIHTNTAVRESDIRSILATSTHVKWPINVNTSRFVSKRKLTAVSLQNGSTNIQMANVWWNMRQNKHISSIMVNDNALLKFFWQNRWLYKEVWKVWYLVLLCRCGWAQKIVDGTWENCMPNLTRKFVTTIVIKSLSPCEAQTIFTLQQWKSQQSVG